MKKLDEGLTSFDEAEPYEVGFASHYDQHLKPLVRKFENSRQDAVKKFKKRLIGAIILTPIVLVLSFYIPFIEFDLDPETFWGDVLVWWVIGFVCGVVAFVCSSINNYKGSIKQEIFPRIISFLGEYSFDTEIENQMKRFESSQIVPRYHKETSEDRTTGTYKGVNIEFFETHLERRKWTSRTGSHKTTFDGVVISLSVKKSFEGQTIIMRDGGMIGNFLKSKFVTSLEKAGLEDPKFENIFEVFTNDQVEARYLLTTSFMERLLELNDVFEGKGVQCSFYKDTLLIMIPSDKDFFEAGSIFKREDFIDDAKALLKEMNMIFSVIDILKLDQDIGL